jgi:hypothetical protein
MSAEASTLLGLLADDDRLRSVAALVLGSGPASVSEVADAAGLDIRRAAKALTRLAGAGLVDQTGDSYVLRSASGKRSIPWAAPKSRPTLPTPAGAPTLGGFTCLPRAPKQLGYSGFLSVMAGSSRSRPSTARDWWCSTGWRACSNPAGPTPRRR